MTDVDLDSVRAHVEILQFVKSKKAELNRLEDNAKAAIQEALGNQESGKLDGEVVITWTSHKKRQLQQKALKEAHPDLVEEFTELVEARTFKVV